MLIEWSEFVADYLPSDYIRIKFIPQDELTLREIEISTHGTKGQLEYCELVTTWLKNWERVEASRDSI